MHLNKLNSKKKNNKIGRWLVFFGLGVWVYQFLHRFFSRQANHKSLKLNFLDFVEQEKKELKEWRGGKESFKQYCLDSASLFEDYFIPHPGNHYKPKILRPRSLLAIGLTLLFLKTAILGYLFLIYPNKARMSADIAHQTLELINQSRAQNNLPPLKFNPVLSAAALAKARNMIAEDYFAHRSPGGLWPWDWINRDQYPYLYVGENLAMNFSSAQAAHNALMQSPSHKKNILNKKYTEIGIAVVEGQINGRKTDVLVELFAARQANQNLTLNKKPVENNSVTKAEQTKKEAQASAKNSSASKNSETQVLAENSAKISSKNTAKAAPPGQAKIGNTASKTASAEEKSAKKSSLMKNSSPTAVNPAAESANNKKQIVNFKDSAQVLASQTTATSTLARLPAVLLRGTKVAPPLPRLAGSTVVSAESNLNAKIQYYKAKDDPAVSVAEYGMKFLYWLFVFVLFFLVVALVINIFVRITVQHKGVIVQTLLVIIFISALLLIRLHPVEYLLSYVVIV